MKILLGQLLNTTEVFKKLLNQEMPIKILPRIIRLAKKIDEELIIFQEVQLKLLKKYGENIDGKLSIKEENNTEFMKEYQEALKEEIEIILEPISIKDFGDAIILTPNDYILLIPLLRENEND